MNLQVWRATRCYQGSPSWENEGSPCRPCARFSEPMMLPPSCQKASLAGTHLSPRKVPRRSLGTFSSRPPHKAPVAVLPSAHAQQCGEFQTGDGKQRRTTKAATTRLRTCSNDSGSKCHHAARTSAWRLGLLVTRTCHRLPFCTYIK